MASRTARRDISRMMRKETEIGRASRRLGHSVAMTINGKPAIVPASRLRVPKT